MLHCRLHSLIQSVVMRRATVALFLIAVIAAPALVLRSQTATLWLVGFALTAFTEQRLELVDPQIALYRGVVSAQELHLYPSDGPPLLTILELDATISLLDLLRNDLAKSVFRAKSVQIYVSDNDESADPDPMQWMQYANWLPHQLTIEQFHLVSAARELWIFPLKNILGMRLGPADFRISAEADYEGEPLKLQVDLLGVTRQSDFHKLKIKSQIQAPRSGSILGLSGEATASKDQLSYKLQLDAQYEDVSAFLNAVDGTIDLEGKLKISGIVQGNTQGFELSQAQFLLDNMPAYGFEAGGELTYSSAGKSSLRLVAAGEMESLEPLINWLDLDLTALGSAQANITISGEIDQLAVEEFILVTQSEDGLGVNLSGHLKLGDKSAQGQSPDDQVRVDLHGVSLAVLSRWIGDIPYDTGPWRASGLIHRSQNSAQLNDIIVEAGEENGVQIWANGRIGQVFGVVGTGLSAVQDIDLMIRYQVPDSAELATIIGAQVPAYHEVTGHVRLTGSPSELYFSEGTAEVLSSDLEANLTNMSGVLKPDDSNLVSRIYADLDLSFSDTSALSQYLSEPVLSLGELSVSGSLTQSANIYGIANVNATIVGDTVMLTSQGSIDDIATMGGVRLETQFSGMDTRSLLTNYLEEFSYPGQLGALSGSFTLARPKEEWNLTHFSLRNENNESVQLEVNGSILDVTGLPETVLSANFELRDATLLEALTTLKLKPATGNIDLTAETGRMKFEGQVQLGDSVVTGHGELEHENNAIRGLTIVLESPSILLDDIGMQADQASYKPSDKLEEVNPAANLEQRLQNSPVYPTDFRLKIDHLRGESSDIEDINIHVTGEQKRYTLRQFSARYDNGPAEIRGIIDLNASPPFVSLAGEVLSVPLYRLSDDLGIDFDIEGLLSVRGGLSGRGLSGEELLSSANGSLALALEDIVVEGAAYDVLATDFLAWIYSGAVLEKSTEIDCTMAKFTFKNGVARSDSIFIESRRMVATGKGKLDLPRQKIDITLTPRSKAHRLSIPSSVSFKGDLNDPRTIVSPISATAKASTDLLLLVPRLAMKVFGVKDSGSTELTPCVADI